ncbi:MAG: chemotaxis protein CheX [Spirochaetia bacterium]
MQNEKCGLFDSPQALSYTPEVQQKILDVFIEAVRQVFHETDILIDSVDMGEAHDTDDQVITSVGLIGDLKGVFMLRTDTPSAASILRAMAGGVRIAVKDDILSNVQLTAMGELANQISGRAITLLSERHLSCDITSPTIVAATQLQSLVPDVAVTFRRTIRGPFGRLTLFLGMQDLGPSE